MISAEMKDLVKALVDEIVHDCYEDGVATCGIETDSGRALIAAIEKLEAERDNHQKAAYMNKQFAETCEHWAKKAEAELEKERNNLKDDAALGALLRRMPEAVQGSILYLAFDPIPKIWSVVFMGNTGHFSTTPEGAISDFLKESGLTNEALKDG